MNESPERDRNEADASDASALTQAALKKTQQVMRDSEKLLARAKDLPQPDVRDDATLND